MIPKIRVPGILSILENTGVSERPDGDVRLGKRLRGSRSKTKQISDLTLFFLLAFSGGKRTMRESGVMINWF